MTHYAFIVGVNYEWPEQRYSLGDIGLARCLRHHCQLPRENLVEVYDERATRSNILYSLKCLLDRRNADRNSRFAAGRKDSLDTLLFYYGGHGVRTEFCTYRHGVGSDGKAIKEPWMKHSEIIDLLETKFRGGTAWCIIDCCHSGGFGRAVIQKYRDTKTLHVNYGCVMTVPPSEIAGMEWTITECFIRAFKGELRCSSGTSDDENHCFYLSLKNGIHPNKESNGTDNMDAPGKKFGSHPTWEQVIEYLADEMVRIKGDRLTTLFRGKEMEDGRLLQSPCHFGDATPSVSNSTAIIHRNETWMDPFRRVRHTVNDGVFVKWIGHPSSNAADDNVVNPSFQIGWYPGRVTSITPPGISSSNDKPASEGNTLVTSCTTACIELYDVISEARWTATLPIFTSGRNTILGGLPCGFGFDPLRCVDVITRMARKLAYFDTTIPPGIKVKALWNEKFHSAKTTCRSEIVWDEIDFDSSLDMKGPCVPLRWEDDKSISFVPTHACIIKTPKSIDRSNSKRKGGVQLAELSSRDSAEIISTPMDAMLTSFACDRKKLHGKSPILGGLEHDGDSNNYWEAYDAEDCKWLLVHLMNQVDSSVLPLKVLAFHMCYNESESFSIVYWDTDSTLSIIPNSCLRRREKTGGAASNADDTSDDDSSADGATDESTVRKYIADLQIG